MQFINNKLFVEIGSSHRRIFPETRGCKAILISESQPKKMRGRRTKEIPVVLIRRYRPVKLPEET